MRIAVCLYGQYRTGDYCLPWITKQFAFAKTEYFVHTKNYSTEPNNGMPNPRVRLPQEIHKNLVSKIGPHLRDYKVVGLEDDEKFSASKGRWHYASMFNSLQQAVYMALARHISEPFDLIVVQRLDTLVGPRVDGLASIADRMSKTPHSVFSMNPEMRFMPEGMQHGIHDVFLAGQPRSINLLVAQTFEATSTPRSNDWARFLFEGPNVFLNKAARASNLHVRPTGLGFAIVRTTADLSQSVFDSYQYHERYWHTNHKNL